MSGSPPQLLEARGLRRSFVVRQGVRTKGRLLALDDVSLSIAEGETLGLVGESGCGKTTLARCLVRLLDPDEGSVRFAGEDITHLKGGDLRRLRRRVRIVLQDAVGALNPRIRVGAMLEASLRIGGASSAESERSAERLLAEVGLGAEHLRRYPHELSGGEAQRVGIARALASEPRLLVLDEPVSALDVSVRAQVINLLADLQERRGVAYLFIAHDLAVVRQVSHRIAVMYLGRIVEQGDAEDLCRSPRHHYTAALLDAAPIPDHRANRARSRVILEGEPASPLDPPPGCRFHPRCPRADDICRSVAPPLADHGPGRQVACHHPLPVAVG